MNRIFSRELLPEWEAWSAIVGNILLFIYKIWVAVLIGSSAVAADSWHTLSDSLSSIILLIGVRISRRPPDRDHPYGHGRAEIIASIIIALMLAGISFEFFCEGVRRLVHHESASYGSAAVIAMLVTVAVKEAMAQFAFYAARKTGMGSLKADGFHHRSDALSSLLILAGIWFGGRFWWIDGVMTLIVALMILPAAWKILMESADQMLGKQPDKEFLQHLTEVCHESFDGQVWLHHVHIHNYGAHKEVTFHILLDRNMPLEKAHRISSSIEQNVYRKMGCIATIHVEPAAQDHSDGEGRHCQKR